MTICDCFWSVLEDSQARWKPVLKQCFSVVLLPGKLSRETPNHLYSLYRFLSWNLPLLRVSGKKILNSSPKFCEFLLFHILECFSPSAIFFTYTITLQRYQIFPLSYHITLSTYYTITQISHKKYTTTSMHAVYIAGPKPKSTSSCCQ